MIVYVLNKNGKPLMPCKPQKARNLLKAGKAIVVKRTPFTIKLKYGSSGYVMFGFRLFDKIKLYNKEGFIFGRRANGYFDIRNLDGTKLSTGVNYKKLKLLEPRRGYLVERRKALLPAL